MPESAGDARSSPKRVARPHTSPASGSLLPPEATNAIPAAVSGCRQPCQGPHRLPEEQVAGVSHSSDHVRVRSCRGSLPRRYQPDRRIPLHLVPPAYAAPIPQLADTLPHAPRDELSNSAAIPHSPQGVTHEACAPDLPAYLRVVITAWPTLSDPIRAQILRLIQ